ncbi:hypothetical protein B0A55_10317 [Friedmanniomyces simplex]|uniref:DUF8212 domain-containing protein n=1 Tax=Friedmanniomyces simplex TaxID=329884 RepID=A0A4V5NDJ7_9PEZI|nr:hypothetical protein B0A55_10317 [Friedmanniomyces simplex]
MFKWYQDSTECYVFMDDLTADTLPKILAIDQEDRWRQGLDIHAIDKVYAFMGSRWFTRGWTLQKLLAPTTVLFYSSDHHYLGTEIELAPLISQAASIRVAFVTQETHIYKPSVAQRMSWASARTTTRPEDMAYSLLGIFDLNMPLLYGEGKKAFRRLQGEIIRQSEDESILAWGLDSEQKHFTGVLADDPSDFKGSGNVWTMEKLRTFDRGIVKDELTNKGLAISYIKLLIDLSGTARNFGISGPKVGITLKCFNVHV